jgi:hypothetical protein
MNKNVTNHNIEYDKKYLEKISVCDFNFIVHKNDTCIADCLRSGCLFEKFIVTFVRHFINPNRNIIDLGANIGTHTIIYSNYTNGKIYSFEPQKTIFDILNKNIELNNCKNVITYNLGGSNINKKFYMNACYENKENQGAFKIDLGLDDLVNFLIRSSYIFTGVPENEYRNYLVFGEFSTPTFRNLTDYENLIKTKDFQFFFKKSTSGLYIFDLLNGIDTLMPFINCPEVLDLCSGNCVDLQTDSNNCGACGNQIPSDSVCGGGQGQDPNNNNNKDPSIGFVLSIIGIIILVYMLLSP